MTLNINKYYLLNKNHETLIKNIENNCSNILTLINKEIEFYRSQPSKTRADRQYRDSIVGVLQKTKDEKIQAIESKISNKSLVIIGGRL